MSLRLEKIGSAVLLVLSLILILRISVPLFIFPFIFSIFSLFGVKIKELHFISINFLLFSFFSYLHGYYFILAVILLLILFYTLEFDKNEILKSFIFCFVFLFFYCTYGMTYLSIIYGLLAGCIFYCLLIGNIISITSFSTSLSAILILILDPISYRFAGGVTVVSLLLYGIYPLLKNRLPLNEELVYYQVSFFLLIGAFLSMEISLFYPIIFLLPYVMIIKREIVFDSEKLLKTAFSVLGFWIILIRFNDLGYLGLFFSFSAGILIYLLNDIIEED